MKAVMDLQDTRIFLLERELTSLHRIAGNLIGYTFPINEIRLVYPRPSYARVYEDIFHCPVFFNADGNLVFFDAALLSVPLPMSKRLTQKMLEKECRELTARAKSPETVTEKARRLILMHREEGVPSIKQLAASMNMSERTLRRKLDGESASYKSLVADIRKEKAIHLLHTTDDSMETIAFKLGYKDLPNSPIGPSTRRHVSDAGDAMRHAPPSGTAGKKGKSPGRWGLAGSITPASVAAIVWRSVPSARSP